LDFRKDIAEPISQKRPGLDVLGCRGAYDDVQLISTIMEELEARSYGKDIFALAAAGDLDGANSVARDQRVFTTLLKAVYVFANIFMSRLLGEIMGVRELSFGKFLQQTPGSMLDTLSLSSTLPAYCVYVYRNKVIAHHTIERDFGFKWDTDGTIRLIPFPKKMRWSPENVSKLEALAYKYSKDIPDLISEGNYYGQLELLLYGIPIGCIGSVNPDRHEVNRLAEYGGCVSYTRIQVLNAVDDFALAIVRAL